MKNFNIVESSNKDKVVQDFIGAVNPYRAKPSLGIDLWKLSKCAKESKKAMSPIEIQKIKIVQILSKDKPGLR